MGRRPSAELSWVKAERRWRKKYMGRVFYYAAGDDGKMETESAAKKAFKEWKLQVDIELSTQRKSNPLTIWLDELEESIRATYCDSVDLRKARQEIRDARQEVIELDLSDDDFALYEAYHGKIGTVADIRKRVSVRVNAFLMDAKKKADVGKIIELPDSTFSSVSDDMFRDVSLRLRGTEATDEEIAPLRKPNKVKKLKTKAPPKPLGEFGVDTADSPQTIGTLVDAFLENQRISAGIEDISASRYDKLRVVMREFLEHARRDTPIAKLDNPLLNGWREEITRQVADKELAAVTGRDRLAVTKRMVNWAYNRGHIATLPRCLTARGRDAYTVSFDTATIEIAKTDDIAAMLAVASPRAKLVILLGLNCGYGPRDIGGILKKEIDWKAGTITRARTKTSKRDKPTIVCFKLWPETIEAIRANLSTHAELAFTTDTGNPLVNETIGEDGIVKRHDAVHSIWFRLTKHAKVKTQLKQLRKLGATKMKEKYPQFVDHYLSHAAGKVSDIHYAATYQAGFNEALAWLRMQVLPSSMTATSKPTKPARKR